MPITVENIIKLANIIKPGDQIPGLSKNKFYEFISLEEIKTQDNSNPLNGLIVIRLSSTRKRPIRLFVNVIYLYLYDDIEHLRYGKQPEFYNQVRRSGLIDYVPNLIEFQAHYKAMAIFLLKMRKKVDFDLLI